MDVFIGLDVSLASTAICVLGEKGKIVTEARVASAPESLVAYMRALPHGIAAIGLEAGPLSQWLHKGLTDAGFEAVLMETRLVKGALKAMPIKTDRRDAEGIARLLQMGWFRPVHCKSVSSQEVTDMRRGMNTLALQVQEDLGHDPHAGDLYIFRGRRGDLVKILWSDGVGTSLYAKRLERGRFQWPVTSGGAVSISAAQLGYLLEGIDWRNPVRSWRPSRAG